MGRESPTGGEEGGMVVQEGVTGAEAVKAEVEQRLVR